MLASQRFTTMVSRVAVRHSALRSIASTTSASSRSHSEAVQLFDSFDFNQTRTLCPDKLEKGFQDAGARLSKQELDSIISSFDLDNNGSICFDEFYQLINSDAASAVAMPQEACTVTAGVVNPDSCRETLCISKTDTWQQAVTEYKSAHLVSSLFSPDAILLGTVSRTIRTQKGEGMHGIKEYFDYFAKLPGSQVVKREDNVVQVSEDVLVNNAMVYWAWEGEGAPTPEEPLCARMTFVYRYNEELGDVELFQLHSSALPAPKID
jgi:hypothetical protein